MNQLKNLNKKEKITVALSTIWVILSFVISGFISSASASSSTLVFLSIFLVITSPVWLYWTGLWIWGNGYIVKFMRFITIRPLRKVISILCGLVRNINLYQHGNNENEKMSFVKRLIKGDVSLMITYWFFFLLTCNVLLNFVFGLIEEKNLEIHLSTTAVWWLMVFYIFVFCYVIFALIAVWRSAAKYKGNRKWADRARFIVVVNTVVIIFSFISGVKEYYNAEEDSFKSQIRDANESLPRMINEDTRIDNILVQDRDIYYNYTKVNDLLEDIDIPVWKSSMTSHLRTSTCSLEVTRGFLDDNRGLIYAYYDTNNRPIMKIEILKNDCFGK